ncbi:hypothetical protein HXX76_008364 [Chlamydomonas incerta]|uniref:Uncharacterized protein n=1 Tax=Chlamydomonas incerta TaxID=51695 RepID=A0A835STY6_CHLIN|nr:hypothetical protein HXX76_008364 [Chlamydomonas incerta]|eukprot:KAG2433297.1 hypothetical protein HXX76_008364 [Chlamydomonas incerta]
MSRQGAFAGLLPLFRQRQSLTEVAHSSWRSFSAAANSDAGPTSSGRVAHLASRGVVLAEGQQALSFLQGMVTNDVRPLQDAGAAAPPVYGTILTPKGKFLHDMFISRHPDLADALLLEVDAGGAAAAVQLLNKYKLRRPVSFRDVSSQYRVMAAWGGAAGGGGGGGGGAPPPGSWWRPDPRLPQLGYRALVPAADAAAVSASAGEEAYRAWRYSLGVAEGEAEIPVGQAAPLDFNVDVLHGVSYTKGCYVGQERNSFTHYRGVIRKRLMPVRLEATAAATAAAGSGGPGGPALPAIGVDVLDAATGKSVGQLRGAAASSTSSSSSSSASGPASTSTSSGSTSGSSSTEGGAVWGIAYLKLDSALAAAAGRGELMVAESATASAALTGGAAQAALCQRREVHALRPQKTGSRRKGHTLEDLLVANVTPADVAHNHAMRFVREGIAYMESLGVKLSEQCEKRYGYTFITDQKFHHFRLCKSEARLNADGTLSGVQRGASPLAKYRVRFAKKMQVRKERLAAAAAAAAAANSSSTAGMGQRRRRGLLQASDGGQQHAADGGSSTGTLLDRYGRSRSDLLPVGRGRYRRTSGDEGRGGGRALLQAAAAGSSSTANSSGGSSSALMYQLLKRVTDKAANKDDGDDDGASDVYNDDEEEQEAEAEADAAASEEGDEEGGGGGGKGGGGGAAYGKKKAEALSAAFEPDTELPELTAVGTSHKSSVGCYLQPSMPRNVGYKDAQLLCVGRNVVLDTCAHYDGQAEGFNVRFPAPKVGSIKLGCSVKVQLLGERNLTKGYKNRLWWANAQDNAYDVVRKSCDPASGRVVEHPVAFVLRDRYTHTLHELEVLSTIFTSLAVADLPEVRAKGVQIVLADQMPHASYRPTYAAISYPYRLRHLAEAPYPPNTCFRTALFINAFTNSIAFNPNPNTSDCFSPVMIGVHKWLRTLHQELDPTYLARVHHHASETGGITRRQVVWTSRRNLEALRLTSGTGMTEWQSARMVPNENAVVTALQLAILEWNSRSCLLARYYGGDSALAGCRRSEVQFDLVFGEFSDWPYYPDQLMTIYRTGILIGVHGAALTFVTSTAAGESALLELAGVGWEDTQTGNMLNLFPSLAHNMGAYYEQVRYQGPDIDIKIATDALVRAMDEVSARISANTARRKAAEEAAAKAAGGAGAEGLSFNDQYNFDVMFPRACPSSVPNKLKRFVTSHPVQMALNATPSAATQQQ